MAQLLAFTNGAANIPIDQLATFRHVWLKRNQTAIRDQLIALGMDPQAVALYIIPEPEMPPELRAGSSVTALLNYKGWDNGIIQRVDQGLLEIHPHDTWFVHDAATGQRLAESQTDKYTSDPRYKSRWFYDMNPANPGWQEYFWTNVLDIVTRGGWKAVAIDNVHTSLTKIRRQGGCKEYSRSDAYRAAWESFLAAGERILGSDIAIHANVIEHGNAAYDRTPLVKHLHGMLNESFAVGWPDYSAAATPQQVLADLAQSWTWAEQGKELQLSTRGTDAYSGSFCYALYLMVESPGTSFRYTRGGDYANVILLDEYKLELGAPLGRYTVDGLTVSREFEHYRVTTKLDTREATFERITRQPPDRVAVLEQHIADLTEKLLDLEARQTTTWEVILADKATINNHTDRIGVVEQELQKPLIVEIRRSTTSETL